MVANPRSAVASLAVARAQRCTHFAVVAVRVSHPPETMNTEESTARSAAEKRVIFVKTEAGDPVIYSGNPAELPGARFEIKKGDETRWRI